MTFFSTSLKRREERLLFSVLAASSPKADFPPHPPLVRTDDRQRQLAEISRGISCWTGDSWRVWFAILVAVYSGEKNNNPRPFPGSLRTSFYGRTSCRISVIWYVVEQVVGTFGGGGKKSSFKTQHVCLWMSSTFCPYRVSARCTFSKHQVVNWPCRLSRLPT